MVDRDGTTTRLRPQAITAWMAVVLLALVVGPAISGCRTPRDRGAAAGQADSWGDPAATPAQSGRDRAEPIVVRDIDEMIALPDAQFDLELASFMLAVEAGQAARTDHPAYQRQIDALARALARELKLPARSAFEDRRNAEELVDFIAMQRFRFDKSDPQGHNPANLFLPQVLARRRGYCVSLTILALVLAQRLAVPVAAVRVPRHMYLRYGEFFDPRDRAVSFEMTSGGARRDNGAYLRRFNVSTQAINAGAYMKNLSAREAFSDVLSNWGSLQFLDGRFAEAERWYRRALRCDPDNPEAHYNLGTTLAAMDRHADAIRSFSTAISLDPRAYHAWCGRGRIYCEHGDPTVGFNDLAKAIALRSDDPYAYRLRGAMRAELGEFAGAAADFRAVLDLVPDDVITTINLARLLVEWGRMADAQPLIRRALELAPTDPAAEALRRFLRPAAAPRR
jgi:regulator of sirC expression with transglutaminase-like and TPR domain